MDFDTITLDQVVKLSQIAFYFTGGTVAVLTYRSAKRGLLNTVNTEYQKRIMDRLTELLTELSNEFDHNSPSYWAKNMPVKEVVQRVNKDFSSNRISILKSGEFRGGIPMSSDYEMLASLVNKVKSDPFIPRKLREIIIDLLENRASVVFSVYLEEIKEYQDLLAKGKHTETLDENWNWVHNRINQKLYDRGCGISQIEESVHKIRLAVQEYLESFNPLN